MTVAEPIRGVSTWRERHLLDVDGLARDEIERILELAVEMRRARAERHASDLLAAETIGLAFYEASTRTRMSFELAARALGATVADLAIAGSSVAKGESLIDTLRTLERTGVGTVVLRHAAAGAPYLAARRTGLRIVNAGDGAHAHPTQALADGLTLREALGTLDGRLIVIVGDVARSRVARSNLHALRALGAQVRVAGPPAFVAGFGAWPGVEVATSLESALAGADAVMALRIQLERLGAGSGDDAIESAATYAARWQLTTDRLRRLAPGAWLLHPGPTNEGVELSAEAAASELSLIGRQVENGVPVRMAILALLCGVA
jgi:aspartate carbamoyltransferase catalytic subunit